MVGRGGIDPCLWNDEGPDDDLRSLVKSVVQAVAVLAIRVRAQEAKLAEQDRLASHIDYMEGEVDDLQSTIKRVDARIDGLVSMLTEAKGEDR